MKLLTLLLLFFTYFCAGTPGAGRQERDRALLEHNLGARLPEDATDVHDRFHFGPDCVLYLRLTTSVAGMQTLVAGLAGPSPLAEGPPTPRMRARPADAPDWWLADVGADGDTFGGTWRYRRDCMELRVDPAPDGRVVVHIYQYGAPYFVTCEPPPLAEWP